MAEHEPGTGSRSHGHNTALLALVALIAFAANSLLCRLALRGAAIDPISFTALRLGSGALMLQLVLSVRTGSAPEANPGWKGALALTTYALAFSAAYLRLDTGTGALLLFGSVQSVMILLGVRRGERPSLREWLALGLTLGGLFYLASPGLSAPDPQGALLMAVAGVGWGVYSWLGKGTTDPLWSTAVSFRRSVLLVAPSLLLMGGTLQMTAQGVALACASGAIASGLGYVAWYAALRTLSATRAALIQPAVPVLAAIGGTWFLGEAFSARLAVSTAVIVGAILFGAIARSRAVRDLPSR